MRTSNGYTMIELLMVIVVIGILASVGTASFKYVNRSNRISSEINGLLGDMQFARSQAVKTGSYVTICPAAGNACTGTTSWNNGWIIFLDFNGNGAFDSATDTIIRRQGPISPDTVTSTATLTYIVFNREGYGSTPLTTPPGLITVDTNPSNTQWRRCLWISAVGATQIEKGGASSPVTC